MTVMGAVTDIIMQDELVNGLLEFLVSRFQIINLYLEYSRVGAPFSCGSCCEQWLRPLGWGQV